MSLSMVQVSTIIVFVCGDLVEKYKLLSLVTPNIIDNRLATYE